MMFPSSRFVTAVGRQQQLRHSLQQTLRNKQNVLRHFSSTTVATKPITIGILRESYDKWERRAPLGPDHVKQFLDKAKKSGDTESPRVLVQPSSHRIFLNQEYENAGATIQEDLSTADLILGVKRPKTLETLLPKKTYMFFSHVIKGQPENMGLLDDILKKKIQLLDYECISQQEGEGKDMKQVRLVAFGKYAGISGMVNTFQALGQRLLTQSWLSTPFLNCPPTIHHGDLEEVKRSIRLLAERIKTKGLPESLEPLVFTITGKGGKVYNGVREIFDLLPHEMVDVKELPDLFKKHQQAIANGTAKPQRKVYCVALDVGDIYKKKGNEDNTTPFDFNDFLTNHNDYVSTFATDVAPYTNVLLNCAYWDQRFARILTKQDMKRLYESGNERLLVVSDISCDVNGSIEFLERTTTIERPFFQYDPITGREFSDSIEDHGVTVLGVDILPSELPADSSNHFGDAVSEILDELSSATEDAGIDASKLTSRLGNACITTSGGNLTELFRYLDPILTHTPKHPVVDGSNSMLIELDGHLFDSGLINQVLDAIVQHGCGFEFQECHVQPKPIGETSCKSHAILQITGSPDVDINKAAAKITKLVELIDQADATCRRLDRNGKKSPAYVNESKKVLLLGAGRVSKSVADLLGRSKDRTIVVASDNEKEAKEVAREAKQGKHLRLDIMNDPHRASDAVNDSDVVVSLLPAPFHSQIAELCIQHKKDLVTASYESDDMRELGPRAESAGITILNEVGLDPGLDHMSAMKIIDDIMDRGGTVSSFSSVCGGLPAPEAADNPLKYKFSWSPRGVISASQNSARYRMNDVVVEVDGDDLLRNATPFSDGWPDLDLECLPNRDSLHYEEKYSLQNAKTIFRGTLRYRGFSSIMNVFKKMGLFDPLSVESTNWEDLMETLRLRRGGFENLDDFLLGCADNDSDDAARAKHCLEWLDMLNGPIAPSDNSDVVDLVCRNLEEKLQYGDHERDLVVMHHSISAEFEDGTIEHHQSSLQAFGSQDMSAMCKTVGYPTAAATDLVLNGSLDSHSGLLLPIHKNVYDPILSAVKREGIVFSESVSVHSPQSSQEAV